MCNGGVQRELCTVTIDIAHILLGAHIDDFVIACASWQVLDAFRARLLDAFEGTHQGALQHYLGGSVHNTTLKRSICVKRR